MVEKRTIKSKSLLFPTASNSDLRFVTRLADGKFRSSEFWVSSIGQRLSSVGVCYWSDAEKAWFPGENFEAYLITHGLADDYMKYHQQVYEKFEQSALIDIYEELAVELEGIPSLPGKVAFLAQRVGWLASEVDELNESHRSLADQVADHERRLAGFVPENPPLGDPEE